MDVNPLLEIVVTERDRQELLDLLESCYQGLFRNENIKDSILLDNKYGSTLLKILPPNFEKEDYHSAGKLIKSVITQVKELPVVEILLATPPTASTIADINNFLKNKTTKKSVVDIRIDPSILSGAVFMIDGKYIDMSVAGKLNKTFSSNKIQDLIAESGSMKQESSGINHDS